MLQGRNLRWFNINEKQWEYYDVSKLKRFMMLVRLRMQSALRSCIESSMFMFVTMCETPCLCTYWCEEEYVWDESDLLNTPFRSATTTLFHLSLLMSETGPYYTTELNKFDIVLQRLFREMLYRCHFIRQVHPLILTQLVFERDLCLTSIGLLEPPVLEYQQRLKFAYEKAVIPLKAYCKQYEVFREIFLLDVKSYVENFRNEKHSVSETKQEIQVHYDAKQDIINRLPQLICIGPFSINVDTLKDYEVLDVFFRPLDDEDFSALWECVGWPHIINKQIEATEDFLLEEQDKFWKIHMQDEQNLLDKIDMFTQQCMALTLQDDFSKVEPHVNNNQYI